MKIVVVAVGRIRDSGVRALCDDYKLRTERFVGVDEREVPETKGRKQSVSAVMEGEAASLKRAIPQRAFTVALARKGRMYDSGKFAGLIERWMVGAQDVAFLIGGANGLSPEIMETADEQISLSAMTFPHELTRVLLFEQLYRATTILRGEPYHKGG